MSTTVKLLPLPEWAYGNNHLRIKAAGLQSRVTDYARANVAHATAAKDAEIERLRDQVDVAAQMCWQQSQFREQAQARVERLAEALRHLRNHTSVNSYQIELIDAALRDHDQEGGNP